MTNRQIIEDAANALENVFGANAETIRIFNQLRIMLQKMDEGTIKLEEKRDYWMFWRGGSSFDTHEGYSETDAFTRAGYGAGAASSLDFISPVPKLADAIYQRITLPDRRLDDKLLAEHYVAHTWMHLGTLQEAGDRDGIEDVLDKMREQRDYLKRMYEDRLFFKMYEDLYQQVLRKFGTVFVPLPTEGGLQPNELVIISAPTSHGASSCMVNLALNHSRKSDTPILDGLRELSGTLKDNGII